VPIPSTPTHGDNWQRYCAINSKYESAIQRRSRKSMSRLVLLLTVFVARVLIPYAECQAAEPKPAMRGVLVGIDRISPGFLEAWKAKGVNAIVVPLDDAAKQRCRPMAEAVERAGMTLWPWIEVARNPHLAAAHPDWMAAIGGHHDDWRRRFPDAPAAKRGEVIKAWPWVPIVYAPAFDAHRQRSGCS
jgi:hypothetical protein